MGLLDAIKKMFGGGSQEKPAQDAGGEAPAAPAPESREQAGMAGNPGGEEDNRQNTGV